MRPSPLRHPLAILRTIIGLTQKEMATLVNRTPSTIQSVELGKLPLSQELAMLIAEATGVDPGWLLEGNPATPPRKGVTAMGSGSGTGEYTRTDYEFHRAFLESPVATAEELKAAHQAALKSYKAGQKLVTFELPIFKRVVLANKQRELRALDKVIVQNLQSMLDETATSRQGDLVRWKVRQFLRALAEEHHLSALDKRMVGDPSGREVPGNAATLSPGNSPETTPGTSHPGTKAQDAFKPAEHPSMKDLLTELSADKPGGRPAATVHPGAARPEEKKQKTK